MLIEVVARQHHSYNRPLANMSLAEKFRRLLHQPFYLKCHRVEGKLWFRQRLFLGTTSNRMIWLQRALEKALLLLSTFFNNSTIAEWGP